MLDFVRGLAEHFRLPLRIHHVEDFFDEVQHRKLNLVRQIERFSGEFRLLGHLLGKVHVSRGSVLNEKVIANERAVRADQRTLTS